MTIKICKKCGEKKSHKAKGFCTNCYLKYGRPIVFCEKCGKLKHIHGKGLCRSCYEKYGRPKRICKECRELKTHAAKGLCQKCYIKSMSYNYKPKIIECKKCGELKPCGAKGLYISCYQKQLKPRIIICKNCGESKPHESRGLCKSCYVKYGNPNRLCKRCRELKPHSAFGMCHDCYELDRRSRDNEYNLIHILRSRIRLALKGKLKHTTTLELLGCSTNEAVKHFEEQFESGMSWDNWGRKDDCWQIDHTLPINTFDLTKPEEQQKCFHYTNLRPIWARDNRSRPKDGRDINLK